MSAPNTPPRVLVGLTGGLAAGKSTVARLLAEAGCTVADADALVAELYRPGEAGAARVRELFGDGVLTAAGGVDHPALAARAFADPANRRRLEKAIHPLVGERFRALAAERGGIVVLEATLLVEAGWAKAFDLVVTVEAPPEVRLRRAIARGLPLEEARRRLAAQGEGDARRAAAGRILHNDGDSEHLRAQVEALVRDLRRLLAERRAPDAAPAG
ncbi:MAG TPA: dephospho-CoA kinase [Thermoanaerobaculia bacterium]|nr:dephospho-CoA kinase [Thermoanaerobaculia bacterium]